jgi:hypothetical protein
MNPSFLVKLSVKERGQYLYASCAEVPGLHVMGQTPEDLRGVAMRAVADLFKRNRNMAVEVLPTDDLTELRVRPT